jgi:hypothetical protein
VQATVDLHVIEGIPSLGLPTTADRDKYMAFMKIALDQREFQGQVTNPIRFSGGRTRAPAGFLAGKCKSRSPPPRLVSICCPEAKRRLPLWSPTGRWRGWNGHSKARIEFPVRT